MVNRLRGFVTVTTGAHSKLPWMDVVALYDFYDCVLVLMFPCLYPITYYIL